MPEFNNINYELNNGEKFALICGMLAGLRLQDKTQPPDQVTVTLEPIGVNGLGTIGLMAEDVLYTGNNNISIPVITHDVDTKYSGFTLRVSFNNSRIVINSITDGEFGSLQGTSIQGGVAYTRCLLSEGVYKSEPCIVCWLNCTIVSPPTRNNPIELKFDNDSGYNPNYCSLLTWVLNDTDGRYYSYFITPTENKGCKIISNDGGDIPVNKSNLGDETQVAALGSPSLVAVGTSFIAPGTQALVPIYTNCSIDDNFLYDGFRLILKVDSQWLDILTDINVEGTDEWTLTYDRYLDDNNDLILDITGTRAVAALDNSTAGFIRFMLASSARYIDCLLNNTYSELIGPGGALGVLRGDGLLLYPIPASGWGGTQRENSGWGSGGGCGGSTGGGSYGHGTIWSGSSQDIWIDNGDGNKYPVHLEPGNNDVYFAIPNIYIEDMWIETTPVIEAPGYILIPGGFEFETVIKPEVPLGLSSPRIADRFELKDLYDVEKVTPIIPTDVDNLIDEYTIEDIQNMSLQEIVITFKDLIEEFETQDVFDIVTEHAPTTFYEEQLDEVEVEDANSNALINLIISDNNSEESIDAIDVYDIDIEYPPYSGGTDEIIDNVNSTDVQSSDIINTTITDNNNVDNIDIEDVYDID